MEKCILQKGEAPKTPKPRVHFSLSGSRFESWFIKIFKNEKIRVSKHYPVELLGSSDWNPWNGAALGRRRLRILHINYEQSLLGLLNRRWKTSKSCHRPLRICSPPCCGELPRIMHWWGRHWPVWEATSLQGIAYSCRCLWHCSPNGRHSFRRW